MVNVQLSRDFWLYELPHGDRYTAAEVQELRRTVATVLQPIRRRFGTVRLTSGLYWSDGTRRDGTHAYAGTVDFVPHAPIDEVFTWAAEHLVGNFGQMIHERDHLHVTAPGTPVNGRPRYGETWLEPTEGSYRLGASLPAAPLVSLLVLLGGAVALAVIR